MTVDKQTREQKLKAIVALQEKKRRNQHSRESYVPNDGQRIIHSSLKPFRFVFSGNGMGKTTLGVMEAMWAALGYNPITGLYSDVPAKVVVVLDLPDKVMDIWKPAMEYWFSMDNDRWHKLGRPSYCLYTFPNGSEIKFMFHQQDQLAFESIEVDVVIWDEPPPRDIFVALVRGGRKHDRQPKFLLIGTPISRSWLRRDVYDRWARGELPDYECFVFGTVVNEKNLGQGYIERFSQTLTEKEKKIRLEGMFFDLDGLALAHLFKRDKHIIPWQKFQIRHPDWQEYPVTIIIDPHPAKAHVAIALAVDRDGYYYYLREMSDKLVARQFASKLKLWYKDLNVVNIICDSLGSSEGTGGEGFRSFIEVLRDEGIRVRATEGNEKNDADFIDRIRTVLALPVKPNNFGIFQPKLSIIEGNGGVVQNIEAAEWMKYKDIEDLKDKIDLRQLDYLACLKYGLASNIKYARNKAIQSISNRNTTAYGFNSKRCTNSMQKASYNQLKRKYDLYMDLFDKDED